MKFNYLGKVASLVLGAAALVCPNNVQAGWGILGGSNGGSSGGSSGFASNGGSSGGSSGGYAATYGGSSGYAASYGSSGAGSSGGSSGYAVSYGAYDGGSSGGSNGNPGLLQRLASRIHDHAAAKRARHAARRSYYGSSGAGSSGGSSGYTTSYSSYGGGSSGGGSSGGYPAYSNYSGGSSGGSVNYGSTGYRSGVSYGSTGYGASYGAGYGSSEVYYGASNDTNDNADSSLVSDFDSTTTDGAVYLTLAVPSNAKVFVNDNETSSTGTVRKFVSRGLEAGKQYRFEVRAEIVDANGKLLTEQKSLVVSSGDEQQIQFAFAEQDSPIETAITLNLPEGAKVTLAGSQTKAAGETRTFRTARLKAGEFWDDYEIEVEHEGQVKRQSIRLVGGDKLQLTFDFDQPVTNVAAR